VTDFACEGNATNLGARETRPCRFPSSSLFFRQFVVVLVVVGLGSFRLLVLLLAALG